MDLKLKNFGLFQEKTFPLDQVTVFYGANETGKTTLFDAIVSSLIRITGTTSYGKKLKERYGDSRSAQISSQLADVTSSKFLSSYAIREGKMALEDDTKEAKELISSIQKTLFDSGYSSKNLKSICIERASTKGNVKSGKDLNKALETLEAKTSAWKKAEEERTLTFASLTALPKKEKEKSELEILLKQKEASLQALTIQRKELESRQRHSNASSTLQNILLWESKEKAVAEIGKWLSSGKDKLLTKLNEETKDIAREIKSISATNSSDGENLIFVNKGISEVTNQKAKLAKFEGTVFDLERKLEQMSYENVPKIRKTTWKTGFLVSGGLLFSIGILLGLISYLKTFANHWILFSFALALVGLTLVLGFSKSQEDVVDESHLERDLQKLADEVTLRTEGQVTFLLKTKEGIRDALAKYKDSINTLIRELEQLNDTAGKLNLKIAENLSKETKLKESLFEKEKEFLGILQEFGVKNISDFQSKISDAKAEELEFKNLTASLQMQCMEYNLKDILSLKLKIKDEIQSYETNFIGSNFSPDEKTKLRNLQLQIETEKNEYDRSKEIFFAKESELSGLVGGSQVKIKDILEKCDLLRREMEEADALKQSLEKNIKAYGTLANIFSEMDEGSESQMLGLVQSLSKRWNEIIPEENLRKIEWTHLTEVPKAFDKTNIMRSLDLLSTGTKELFYFSMRIEYALRMSAEDGLHWILLDEPFRHMDPMRMQSAVRYSLDFVKQENWNAVFFTFDGELKKELVENAKELNLPCILHTLG
jgi:ABC-type cobalamin/Fe3+-siderophores transport system ATPase subunit